MKHAVSIALIFSAGFFCAQNANAYTGEKYAKDARISMERATLIALKARAGKVTDRELEKEKGGSGLRYSFDIRSGKETYEVGVDAVTGDVLENSVDNGND